jgi:hypothetical protein
MKKFPLFLVAAAFILLACDLTFNINPPPTATVGPAAPTSTPDSPYPWPDQEGECTLTVGASQAVYDRPSTEANVFGDSGDNFAAQVLIRTQDGWVGFDPGVAQAANIGVFRYRWLHFDQVALAGGCVDVPQATWVPAPDLCYDMPMETHNVYASADTSSEVIATLGLEEFAAVIAVTSNGWAQVNLEQGNTGQTGVGWVELATINWNGTLCDELPVVSS